MTAVECLVSKGETDYNEDSGKKDSHNMVTILPMPQNSQELRH